MIAEKEEAKEGKDGNGASETEEGFVKVKRKKPKSRGTVNFTKLRPVYVAKHRRKAL